jgi:PAS domain S-box-containing protein
LPNGSPSSGPGSPALQGLEQELQRLRAENESLRARQHHWAQMLLALSRSGLPPEAHPVWQEAEAAGPLQELIEVIRQYQQESAALRETLARLEEERNRELAVKEANLSALVENTEDGIVLVDAQDRVRVINSALRQMLMTYFGQPVEAGDCWAQTLSPSLSAYWQPFFRRALSGEAFRSIHQLPWQGSTRYFELSFNPVRYQEGEPDGVSIFVKDISEKQEAIEQRHAKEKMLASITYSIQEGIFRTSQSGQIVYVNKAFASMMGYGSEEEVLPMNPDVFYVDLSRREYFRSLIRVQNSFINEEVEFKRKDGSTFWGLMSSVRTVEENGTVYHDGAIRDVTHLREQDRRIRELNTELMRVNQELDRFVYSTSHDLRAPLVSLAGLVNVSRLSQSEEDRRRYLDLMDKSIQRLDHFIRDVICYSRNARLEVAQQAIDFESLIGGVFQSLQYLEGADTLLREVEVSESRAFYSDPSRIEIILSNLISNAIRYRDVSKPQCRLHLRVCVGEAGAEIIASDNGIGIDPNYHDRIFDMFFRASKLSQGSGIGLYIVREAVHRLGGEISISSQPGQGASFRILLPHPEAAEPEAVPS